MRHRSKTGWDRIRHDYIEHDISPLNPSYYQGYVLKQSRDLRLSCWEANQVFKSAYHALPVSNNSDTINELQLDKSSKDLLSDGPRVLFDKERDTVIFSQETISQLAEHGRVVDISELQHVVVSYGIDDEIDTE